MDMSPHTPLRPHHYEMRQKIMNRNGIHIIYPFGRDFAIQFPGKFDAYQGLTVRVFGYTRDAGPTYEHAIGNGVAYALMKFVQLKPAAVLRGPSGFPYGTEKKEFYGPGTFYTFAIRAIRESYFGESFQAMVDQQPLNYVIFPWSGVSHWETMKDGYMVHLSKHVGDEVGTTKFPRTTGLDPFLNHFIMMEVGTIAHYTGEYIGTGDKNDFLLKALRNTKGVTLLLDVAGITVMAVGAVRDMGRPNESGVTIRISIRKTLGRRYSTKPVLDAVYLMAKWILIPIY
nr:uncharacterized protein LOC129384965 isoform X2 [Dermacentor andersoni]